MSALAGVGLGWRPETAWLVDARPSVAFAEVIAETIDPKRPPRALRASIERGLAVVTHGVSLSLGGAGLPDRARVQHLVDVARALRSPLVSEHVAFCRAEHVESPHFVPIAYTRAQLAVIVDNVRRIQDALPVPLAIENVAAPVMWPGAELAEADFLAELLDRTGALLLLDVANIYANLVNHGGDLDAYLARLPLDRIAYMHVAGGARIDTLWRDTHAHAITPEIAEVLDTVLARSGPRALLLERDQHFHSRAALDRDLDVLEAALRRARTANAAPRAASTVRGPEITGARLLVERAQLAREQAMLLDLVLGEAAAPTGFDPVQLAEARAIVRAKLSHASRRGRT